MNKIQRISCCLKWALVLTLIVLPIFMLAFWWAAPCTSASSGSHHVSLAINYIPEALKINHHLSSQAQILGFLICLIPLSLQLLIIYFLIRLFQNLQQIKIFSLNNVTYLRHTGLALLGTQLIKPFYQVLLSLVLTWDKNGQHAIALSFSTSSFAIILISMLMILFSWIIQEGYSLQQEQRLTV